MANSLYPGYVLIDYHSAYGPHKMILPTRAWSTTNITGVLGSWTGWNATPIDGETMIDSFIAKIKKAFLATTHFDTATIYTLASPTAPAIPQAGKSLGVIGTSVSTEHAKATQEHWTFRDSAYQLSGLTFLDCPSTAGFEIVTSSTASADETDVINEWTSDAGAWSSRAGNRPLTFRKISSKLNDVLRKRYGMV